MVRYGNELINEQKSIYKRKYDKKFISKKFHRKGRWKRDTINFPYIKGQKYINSQKITKITKIQNINDRFKDMKNLS